MPNLKKYKNESVDTKNSRTKMLSIKKLQSIVIMPRQKNLNHEKRQPFIFKKRQEFYNRLFIKTLRHYNVQS